MNNHNKPSILQRLALGFSMGGGIGLLMGSVIGTFTVLINGPGPKGYLKTIGKSAFSSAAFFGVIMSVGSLIRSQELYKYKPIK